MKEKKHSSAEILTAQEAIKKRLRDFTAPYADCSPSEVTEFPWIYAKRKVGTYPPATAQSGKWLIFTPVEQVDLTWATIKTAVEAGHLGNSAKVATMYPNSLNTDPSKRVICVYTYDWTDEVDVLRVRQALRDLGFTWKLGYKTDQDTRDGKYRHRGDTRISKYYE